MHNEYQIAQKINEITSDCSYPTILLGIAIFFVAMSNNLLGQEITIDSIRSLAKENEGNLVGYFLSLSQSLIDVSQKMEE